MKITNKHNLPASITRALSGNDYDPRRAASNVISLTSLIGPPKVRQLTMRHWDQISADVSEYVWRVFGGAVHEVISKFAEEGERLSEERIAIDCEDWTVHNVTPMVAYAKQAWYNPDKWYVSLRFDNYEYLNEVEGIVQDFKVTSAWSVAIENAPKVDWKWQLRIEAMALQIMGFPVVECQNILILRDWTQSKVGGNYPSIPLHVYKYKPYEHSKVKAYILDRLEKHGAAEKLDDDQIPECTFEERWAKEGQWALMKKGRKSAVKLHPTKREADNHCENAIRKDGAKAGYYVEERPGSNVRCEGYCDTKNYCSFYKRTYNEPAWVEEHK